MSRSRNLLSMRKPCWFVVARVFRRGGLLLTDGKTLASEEASYNFGPVKHRTGVVR